MHDEAIAYANLINPKTFQKEPHLFFWVRENNALIILRREMFAQAHVV